MSKFTNVQRVVNYAITEGVGVSAASLMAKRLLEISLSDEEFEQAETMYAAHKRINFNKLEQERKERMYDNRWVD